MFYQCTLLFYDCWTLYLCYTGLRIKNFRNRCQIKRICGATTSVFHYWTHYDKAWVPSVSTLLVMLKEWYFILCLCVLCNIFWTFKKNCLKKVVQWTHKSLKVPTEVVQVNMYFIKYILFIIWTVSACTHICIWAMYLTISSLNL